MTKEELKQLTKEEQEQVKLIYKARFEYFNLLVGVLHQWKLQDKDEGKLMKKLVNVIEEYEDYLYDVIE